MLFKKEFSFIITLVSIFSTNVFAENSCAASCVNSQGQHSACSAIHATNTVTCNCIMGRAFCNVIENPTSHDDSNNIKDPIDVDEENSRR
jgi:hypothetical protein